MLELFRQSGILELFRQCGIFCLSFYVERLETQEIQNIKDHKIQKDQHLVSLL